MPSAAVMALSTAALIMPGFYVAVAATPPEAMIHAARQLYSCPQSPYCRSSSVCSGTYTCCVYSCCHSSRCSDCGDFSCFTGPPAASNSTLAVQPVESAVGAAISGIALVIVCIAFWALCFIRRWHLAMYRFLGYNNAAAVSPVIVVYEQPQQQQLMVQPQAQHTYAQPQMQHVYIQPQGQQLPLYGQHPGNSPAHGYPVPQNNAHTQAYPHPQQLASYPPYSGYPVQTMGHVPLVSGLSYAHWQSAPYHWHRTYPAVPVALATAVQQLAAGDPVPLATEVTTTPTQQYYPQALRVDNLNPSGPPS